MKAISGGTMISDMIMFYLGGSGISSFSSKGDIGLKVPLGWIGWGGRDQTIGAVHKSQQGSLHLY